MEVRGTAGQRLAVEAVIDSGYSGTITLQPHVVRYLGLQDIGVAEIELADGSTAYVYAYEAVVLWHDEEIKLEVAAADVPSLLGTGLLAENVLNVSFTPGGDVSIAPVF